MFEFLRTGREGRVIRSSRSARRPQRMTPSVVEALEGRQLLSSFGHIFGAVSSRRVQQPNQQGPPSVGPGAGTAHPQRMTPSVVEALGGRQLPSSFGHVFGAVSNRWVQQPNQQDPPSFGPGAGTITGVTRQIASSGTTSFATGAVQSGGTLGPEISPDVLSGGDSGSGSTQANPNGTAAPGIPVASASVANSNPELVTSFDGLNHYQQRTANGGNQFSLEPPDEGLCVGNGLVLEAVNDVLRVYDTKGNPKTNVIDLNTFFGYHAAINRTTGTYGQFVTDPSCYFDQPTQRWFVDVLTLERYPTTGDFTGKDHIDIAVSQTADPTGTWTIYRLPVQNDGSDGTPNHNIGAALGDYPHLGADQYGIYITTNEYAFSSLSGPEVYHAAQIYAFPKAALASGASDVTVTQFDTVNMVHSSQLGTQSGFTIWPANSPGGTQYASGQGGTEYFLSSNAAEEVNNHNYAASRDLIIWALTNTQSLDTASPALTLTNSIINVNTYSLPPQSAQKPGNFPLGQALNIPGLSTKLFGSRDPYAPEVESKLDSNDTRMQQVVYANGMLWGALDTAVTVNGVNGVNQAGIAWYIINPQVTSTGVSGSINKQGFLGLAGNNLTYPAIAVTSSGQGYMAFTVVGNDYYPSAGYAPINASAGVGAIHIAAVGQGPEDGFTGYKFFGDGTTRPRWGDYGAAVADGNSIWVASEYIGETSTLGQYVADPTINHTRTLLANWDTRITQLTD
jgi:hypothetical protein